MLSNAGQRTSITPRTARQIKSTSHSPRTAFGTRRLKTGLEAPRAYPNGSGGGFTVAAGGGTSAWGDTSACGDTSDWGDQPAASVGASGPTASEGAAVPRCGPSGAAAAADPFDRFRFGDQGDATWTARAVPNSTPAANRNPDPAITERTSPRMAALTSPLTLTRSGLCTSVRPAQSNRNIPTTTATSIMPTGRRVATAAGSQAGRETTTAHAPPTPPTASLWRNGDSCRSATSSLSRAIRTPIVPPAAARK